MNIVSKLKARLARAKAAQSNGQAGISIGVIVLIVILLVALGVAASKFAGDSPSGDKQRNKLDAASLVQQSAQMRNGLTLLNSGTDISWTNVANKSGKMSVATASTDFTDSATIPVGPVGTDATTITWTFGSLAGVKPVVYAFTKDTVNLEVCRFTNSALIGGDGTPATASLSTLGSATAATLASGNAGSVVLTAAMQTALEGTLTSSSTACAEVDTGKYRIVSRLN